MLLYFEVVSIENLNWWICLISYSNIVLLMVRNAVKYTGVAKTHTRECVNITQYNTVIRFSCLTNNITLNSFTVDDLYRFGHWGYTSYYWLLSRMSLLHHCMLNQLCQLTGKARNLLRGQNKTGGLGTEPPAGSRGRAPVGVWGQRPQKLETYTECITVFYRRK